jgi:hypothetical protein
LVAARVGFELIEDFLSSIVVVTGLTFPASTLTLVLRHQDKTGQNCEFLQFLQLPLNHWPRPLDRQAFSAAKQLLAHWDGLETGHRLRRAARQYRDAIGNFDDTAAFQGAYIGLEAMEPPLASIAGLTAGKEEVKGQCDHCKTEFTRYKTMLVGVRAFVLDEVDPKKAQAPRKADWKLMNTLRNELMHGLVDENDIGERANHGLVAALHYLHDAICICSHAKELAHDKYQLARGGIRYAINGRCSLSSLPPLEKFTELIETSSIQWVTHATQGFVPQMSIRTRNIADLEVAVMSLTDSLSFATEDSLAWARIERE